MPDFLPDGVKWLILTPLASLMSGSQKSKIEVLIFNELVDFQHFFFSHF